MDEVEGVGIERAAWRVIFGARVRDLRTARGWSQEELAAQMSARALPMHQTTVGRMETGVRGADVAEVGVLADLFQVPVGDLFEPPEEVADRLLEDQLKAALAQLEEQEQELREELAAVQQRRLNLDGSNRWVIK